ncbi:Shedu immune nuclease family protein [Sphingomonas psychrotolerans]|uniref:Shedu protein SduA C-terminal domain-containing protein n=1 Tax=Sphingomonas psychrotolerans TaxID=1327635 RepID=A0A2K8MMD0_9SPHN|nr:Shedu immune nuclease family protein [Sphingomonas psychrotolerans]ATY32979.1 hypothetical protein CVN68_14245 [Sphingomonas psychrotolerans]
MAATDFDLLLDATSIGMAYTLQMSRVISRIANPELKPSEKLPNRLLFEVHIGEDELITYPTYTRPTERFLTGKYAPLKSISFALTEPYTPPETREEAIAFLDERLPPMFIRDPAYGLGVTTLIAPLLNVIRDIDGIAHLAIGPDATRIEGDIFHLNSGDYEDLRLHFGRVARNYQNESRIERTIAANDMLLHALDATRFPLQGRPYQAGTIHKLLGGPQLAGTALRGKDRIGVARAAAANAKVLAQKDPLEFAALQRDIQLVSLEALIARFRDLMAENASEPRWQTLFDANPFILSMVFGYPVVLVASGTPVGGIRFGGNGQKFADFLYKNDRTQNAALVEIKRPDTELVGPLYRGEVWPPHGKLSGAITQVLDQRAKFIKTLPLLKDNSDYAAIEAHAVDCVVVAGRTPENRDKRAGFELFRSQLKDVRIVTFDELLAKLELLRDLLADTGDTQSGSGVGAAGDEAGFDQPYDDEDRAEG